MADIKERITYVLEMSGNLKNEAKETAASVTSLGSAAGASLKVLAGASTVVLAAAASFVSLAEAHYAVVDSMGDLAAASGLETETIQGLRLAARATGGDLEKLIPKDLPDLMLKAAGGSEKAAAGFRTLGVEIVDSTGHLRSADDVLWETLDALYAIPDPTTRAALAAKTLGSAGKELLGTFEDTAGLERFVAGAREFGIQAGPEAAAAAARWQNATANLKLAMEDVGVAIVDTFGESTTNFMNNVALGTVYLTALFEGLAGVAQLAGDEVIATLTQITDHLRGEKEKAEGEKKIALGEFGKAALKHEAQDVSAGHIKTGTEIGETIGDALKKSMDEALERAKAFRDSFLVAGAAAPGAGGAGDLAVRRLGEGTDPSALDRALGAEVFREGQLAAAEVTAAASDKFLSGLDDLMAGSEAATFAEIKELQATQDALDAAAEATNAAAGATSNAAAMSVSSTVNLAHGMMSMITSILTLPREMATFIQSTPDMLMDALLGALDFYEAVPEAFERIISEMPAALIEVLPDMVIAFFTAPFRMFATFFEVLGEGLMDLFSADFWINIGKELGNSIGAAIYEIVVGPFLDAQGDWLGTDLNNKDGKGTRLFGIDLAKGDKQQKDPPSFANETPMITRSGLAIVHRGESIQKASRGAGPGVSISIGQIVTNDPHEVVRVLQRAIGAYGLNLSLDGRP